MLCEHTITSFGHLLDPGPQHAKRGLALLQRCGTCRGELGFALIGGCPSLGGVGVGRGGGDEITSVLLLCYQSMYSSCNTIALHVAVAALKVLGR